MICRVIVRLVAVGLCLSTAVPDPVSRVPSQDVAYLSRDTGRGTRDVPYGEQALASRGDVFGKNDLGAEPAAQTYRRAAAEVVPLTVLQPATAEEFRNIANDEGMRLVMRQVTRFEANLDVIAEISALQKRLLSEDPSQRPFEIYKLTLPARDPFPEHLKQRPEMDKIYVTLYIPISPGTRPLSAVMIPSLIDKDPIAKVAALYLASHGYLVAEMALPLHGPRAPPEWSDLNTPQRLIKAKFDGPYFQEDYRQSLRDLDALYEWLAGQTYIDRNHIGVLGQSHSGAVAAHYYLQKPDLAFLVSLLPILDYAHGFYGGDPGRDAFSAVGAAMAREGISQSDFRKWSQGFELIPAAQAHASRINPMQVLLGFVETDDLIPFAEALQLHDVFGKPKLILTPGDPSHRIPPHLQALTREFHTLLSGVRDLLGSTQPAVEPADAPLGLSFSPEQVLGLLGEIFGCTDREGVLLAPDLQTSEFLRALAQRLSAGLLRVDGLQDFINQIWHGDGIYEALIIGPLIPLDIPSGPLEDGSWLPMDWQEQAIALEKLPLRVATVVKLVQEELSREDWNDSLFLIGSSVTGKESDIDLFTGRLARMAFPKESYWRLKKRLQSRLMRELGLSEPQTKDVLTSFNWEIRAIRTTLEKYGFALRITANEVSAITFKPAGVSTASQEPSAEKHSQRTLREAA